MKGHAFLLLCVILTASNKCEGIQLTLEQDVPITQGGRVACGILTCVERSQDTTSTTSSAQLSDPTSSRNPVDSITRMDVYKTGPGGSAAQSDSRQATLLASVTSQQPTVSRVANAIKVDGRLESATTTIRLELFKQQDCRAEFTCEVLAVDALGREIVRTSHLMQQPQAPPPDMAGEKGWTPAVAMHLVDLAQQLNTNMELIKSSMDDYRDRMGGVEVKVDFLEREISKEFMTLGVKMDSISSNVEHKLDHLEDKRNFAKTDMHSKVDEMKDLGKIIKSKIEDFEMIFKQQQEEESAKDVLSQISVKIDEVAGDQLSFENSLKNNLEEKFKFLQQETERSDLYSAENLRMLFEQSRLNITENVASNMSLQVSQIEHLVDDHFKELASTINESIMNSRSSVEDTVRAITVTNASEIASVVTDILTPKTCKRGMISLLTHPSYPYPVVNPGPGDTLTVPYLCDTLTDGGGWILVQRRTTGKVDFYRTWADYKRGFGTLDDDFWLGNNNIHAITSSGEYELRVELRYNGKSAYAHYDKFVIGTELENYALTMGSYDGTAGNSLAHHNGRSFSTFDRDRDDHSSNCAATYTGAWWYGACHDSNLNGKWGAGGNKGPVWEHFSGQNAVSFSEMKIRRLG